MGQQSFVLSVQQTVGDTEVDSSGSGTGSKPDGPNGRQRSRRRAVNSPPRRAPNTSMASWPYSEQDGKNRHLDGYPGRSDWYQRMARNMACWIFVVGTSLVVTGACGVVNVMKPPPWQRVGPQWLQDPSRTWFQPGVGPRSNTNLLAIGRTWLQAVSAIGGECDCAARRHPRFGQWRSPHGHSAGKSPSTSDTTVHWSEHMFPLWTVGRTSPVGVSGRSSRKLVSAFGATGLQNGAASTGLHTMAKAMLLGTTAIIWLESAFHARLLGSVPRGPRQLWTNNLLG